MHMKIIPVCQRECKIACQSTLKIYIGVFNSASKEYKDLKQHHNDYATREEVAYKVAWVASKEEIFFNLKNYAKHFLIFIWLK
jgi:cation transport regulator ChaB